MKKQKDDTLCSAWDESGKLEMGEETRTSARHA